MSTPSNLSGSGLYIVNQDGTYSVVGCSPANATAVIIDTTYNGGEVTTIVENAFQGNTSITSITMPSVSTIEQYAFASCTGLTTVLMPAVASIGRNAFSGCSGLSGDISMPSLVSIGMEAFFNCIGITSVSVPLLTIIEYSAFAYCAGLQTVDMPSATEIQDGAFFRTALTSVVIPTTVAYIGSDAFRSATQSYLTSLTMSGCSFSTGANAFAYNTVLTSVDIPGAITLGTSMFLGCTSLASVTLGEGITTLPDGVFNACNISSIVLPVSLVTIGNDVLNGNPFLTTITIPRNVTSIGVQAFVQNDPFGISTIYFECVPPQSYVYLPYISNVYYPSYQRPAWSDEYIDGWRNSGQIPSSTTFAEYTPSWYTGTTAPSAPANLTIVDIQTLQWTTDADSEVYYSVYGNGSLIGTTITNSGGITLCTLNTIILYSVTYLSVTVSNFIGSATSSVVYVPPPTIDTTTRSPTFQFTSVTDASHYNIYSVVGTSYSFDSSSSSTSYTATGSGTVQYVVTAVATVSGITGESVYSNPRTVVVPSSAFSVIITGKVITWGSIEGATTYTIYSSIGIVLSTTSNNFFNISQYISNGITGFYVTWKDEAGTESEKSSMVWYIPPAIMAVSGDSLIWPGSYNELDIEYGTQMQAVSIYYAPTGVIYLGTITNQIYTYDASGVFSLFVGSPTGAAGFLDGSGTDALFSLPNGIVGDASMNLYVCDYHNNAIRKIDACGNVVTIAFNYTNPVNITINANGILYFTTTSNVYSLDTTDASFPTILLAGNSTIATAGVQPTDGNGTSVQFCISVGIVTDTSGYVYGMDFMGYGYDVFRLWKLDGSGNVSTLLTTNTQYFNVLSIDAQGYLYSIDFNTSIVYRINTDGTNVHPVQNLPSPFYISKFIMSPTTTIRMILLSYRSTFYINFIYTTDIATFYIIPSIGDATDTSTHSFPLNGSSFYTVTASYQGSSSVRSVYSTEATIYGSGLYIMNQDGTYSVVGCSTANATAVIIDTTYNGGAVTTIVEYAFQGNTRITSITMPSVTTIEQYAFASCTGLTTVLMPAVASIGRSAFAGCMGLTGDISMPSLVSIGLDAFFNCIGITSVSMPLLTIIGYNAFAYCTGLQTVDMPSATGIQDGAFFRTSLTSVLIPPTVGYIGSGAFQTNTTSYLTSLIMSGCSFSTGANAFAYHTVLTSVDIPGAVTLGPSMFLGCTSLASVTLGEGITTLPDGVFNSCNLSSIVLPVSLVTIGNGVLNGNPFLTTITIPRNVTSIGATAFVQNDQFGISTIYVECIPPSSYLYLPYISNVYYPSYQRSAWSDEYINGWRNSGQIPSSTTFTEYTPSWYTGTTAPSAPANLTIVDIQTLQWTTDADSEVYYRVYGNDSLIGTTITRSGGITLCTLNTIILYSVTYLSVTVSNFIGSATSSVVYVPPPTIDTTTRSPTFQFTSVTDASHYNIYSVVGRLYLLDSSSSSTSYTATGSGIVQYVVTAVATVSGITSESVYSNTQTVVFPPPTLSVIDNTISFIFTPVDGVTYTMNGYAGTQFISSVYTSIAYIPTKTYSLYITGSDGTTTPPAVYVPPPTVTLVNTTLTWPTITSTGSMQYNLYADGSLMISNITTPYTLLGNAGSTMSFTVTTEALGIESAPSNAIDVYFPSVPYVSIVGSLVSWDSQVGIFFDIYVGESILTTTDSTSYTIQLSSFATIYVIARNGAFTSSPSESVFFIPAPVASIYGTTVTWTDVNADSYSVYSALDGSLLQSSSATNYTISGTPGSGLQVSLLVVANSIIGGVSENSNIVSTFFPVKPTEITIHYPSSSIVEVTWNTQLDVSYVFYANSDIYSIDTGVVSIAIDTLSGITTMYVVASYNGIFSPSSDIVTYVPIPTNLSLNMSTLSWDPPSLATTDTILYKVYSLVDSSYVLLDSTSSTSYTLSDSGVGGFTKTIVITTYDESLSAESAFTTPIDVSFSFVSSPGEYGPDVVLAAIQATSNIDTVKDILQNYPDSFSTSILTFSGADVAALVDSFAPGYSVDDVVGAVMNILLCASGSTVDISSSSLSAGSYLYFPGSPGSTLTFIVDGGSPIVITCISTTEITVDGIDVEFGEAFLFNGASYVYIGSGSIVAAPGSSSMPVLSLSGSRLTWSPVSGTDISYSVYLITDGTPVFQDSTANTTWDICASVYSEISIFAITSTVPTYAESMRSNAIIFVPPPSELYITGTTLSWTGPMDVYFTVYGNGAIFQGSTGILSLYADISLQSTMSSFYVVANDADGNVSLPSETVSYAPIPSGLSLKGTLLSWIGPSDVSYTIVVDVSQTLYASGTSYSIASAVSDQVALITIVCVNGYTSDASAPISYYPPLTSVILTGTTLSWTDSTVGVTYSIYSSKLDISGVSSTSQDITPYLQSYGPTYFTVVSTDGSSESAPSNAVVYLAAPTGISLNGSSVSWDTIYEYTYNLYIAGSLVSSGVVSPINLSTYSDVISVSITAVVNSVESGPSSAVVYVPPPTGPAINGTILSWSETASNVTFTVLNTDIAGITATSVDISAVTDVTTLSVLAVASDGSLSVPSESVVYVPAPTDVSLNETNLTWAWSGTGSYNISYHIYVSNSVGNFVLYSTGLEQTLDVSNLLVDAVSFYVTVVSQSVESIPSNTVSIVYPPTILSNSGSVLSWSYSVFDVSFLVYADSTLVASLDGSIQSYPTNQEADMTVDYMVSVLYNGIQSENSATYTLVTPNVPSDVDASGSTLVWISTTSSTVTFNIYRVNAIGSYTLIGTSSDPLYSIVQYSGIDMVYVVTEVSVSQIESAFSDPPFDYTVPFTGDLSGINGSTFVAAALESTTSSSSLKYILRSYQDSFAAPVFSVPVSDTSKLIDISTSAYDPTLPLTVVLCKDRQTIHMFASEIQNGELMYFAGLPGEILTYHIIDNVSDPYITDTFIYYPDSNIALPQIPGDMTVVARIDDDSQGLTISGVNYRLNDTGVMIPFGPNGLMVNLVGIGSWVSQTNNNLIYTVSGTSAYLTSLGNSTGDISIPATFAVDSTTYTVLGISGSGPNSSIEGASLVTAISFDPSSTLTSIPSYAFFSCTNLMYIELPSSVQTIGNNAFDGCTNLESITFTSSAIVGFNPSGSTTAEIGARAQALRASIIVNASGVPFTSSIQNSSLTTIGANAFDGCSKLTTTDCNQCYNLQTIGDEAFMGCNRLWTSFPSSIQSIGSGAFKECNGSGYIRFSPMSLTTLGSQAFYQCVNLSGYFDFSNSSLNSIPVSAFAMGAGGSNLTSVKLSSNITHIQDGAFAYNTQLANILFYPNSSLTYIGYTAFSRCTKLSGSFPSTITDISADAFSMNGGPVCTGSLIFAPMNLRSLGSQAFYSCGSLSGVFDFSNSSLTTIPASAFEMSTSGSSLTSVKLSSGITHIQDSAFSYNMNLTNISLYPNSSLAYIGWKALYSCTMLTCSFPSSITDISGNAFFGVTGPITFAPMNLRSLGSLENLAFAGCTGISGSFDLSRNSTIPTLLPGTFDQNTNLRSMTISPSISSLSMSDVFKNLANFTTLYLDVSNVSYITSGANNCPNFNTIVFNNTSTLTSIPATFGSSMANIQYLTLPDSVTTIEAYTFSGRIRLIRVSLSPTSQLTTIADGAFSGCTNLTTISDLSSCTQLTYIGGNAFSSCEKLNATFPSSITGISGNAFQNCVGVGILRFSPMSLSILGEQAFYQCANLSGGLDFSNSSVYAIPSGAFTGCSKLTSVTFSNAITTIGNSAFYNCTNLTSLYSVGSLTTIGQQSFSNCSKLSAAFPSSITAIYNGAFENCAGSGVLTFSPMNLSTFEDSVFGGCTNLYGTFDMSNSSITSLTNQFVNTGGIGNKLTAVKISDSVISIGNTTFMNCSGISTVSIGASSLLQTIGWKAFATLPIAVLSLPSSVVDISNDAFYNCPASTTIVFAGLPPVLTASGALNTTTAMYGIYPSALENEWLPWIVNERFRSLRMRSSQMSIALTPTSLSPSIYTYDTTLNVYYDASSSVVFTLAGTPNTTYNIYMDDSSVASQPMSSSTVPITISIPNIPDDSYSFYATLTDVAGYTVNSATFTIVVMATPPAAPVINTLTGAHIYNAASSNTLTITISGQLGTTYTLFDATNTITLTGNMVALPRRDITGLQSRPYTFHARLTNKAGLISPLSNTLAITVQLTPPNRPMFTTTSQQLTNVSSIPFTVSGDLTALGATYTIYMDGSSVLNIVASGPMPSSLVANTIAPSVLDGSHTFFVTLTDGAGNVSIPSLPLTIQILTTAPRRPVIALVQPAPPVVVHITNAVSTLNISSVQISISGALNTIYSLYDGTNFCQSGSMLSSPVTATVSGLLDGSHTFSVSLTDIAGNTSVPSLTLQVVTDATPPGPPVIIPMSLSPTKLSTISFTISGEPLARYSFYVDGSLNSTGIIASNGQALINVSSLSNGQHRFHANLTDPFGNISLDSSNTFIVVDTSVPRRPVLKFRFS